MQPHCHVRLLNEDRSTGTGRHSRRLSAGRIVSIGVLSAASVMALAVQGQVVNPQIDPQTGWGDTDPSQTSKTALGDALDGDQMGVSSCAAYPSTEQEQCNAGAGKGVTNGRVPVYTDRAGIRQNSADSARRGASDGRVQLQEREYSDFQRLTQVNTGDLLRVYGSDLFLRPPSTFAPVDRIPASNEYVIGPGDEILLRMSGAQNLNTALTVDRAGTIYLPQVGAVQVAGLRYDQLQKHLETEIGRIFRNFSISVNLGQLRPIQVYVVGEARQPGSYTVGAFSSLLSALFASGGPNIRGSLRQVQLLRGGRIVTELDLYDFILHGDKSKDVRLEQGDVIAIPPHGPQVALAGKVLHPAIYELRGTTTAGDLLSYAGGLLSVADRGHLTLERIGKSQQRTEAVLSLDDATKAMPLEDGDILLVNSASLGFQNTVTVRGNLMNPGRFAWKPGMRLTDIIPDRMSLLTSDYWKQRNSLGAPSPLFEPLADQRNGLSSPGVSAPGAVSGTQTTANFPSTRPQSVEPVPQQSTSGSQALLDESAEQRRMGATARSLATQSAQLAGAGLANDDNPQDQTISPQDPNTPLLKNFHRVQIPVPEIDWSYAVIERLNPETLKSVLIPFNLGKLVMDHDPTQNLELQPGDIVTILSQADIPVSVAEQTKFVRLEGEFGSAGVYSVKPGETLADLVRRAGGISSNAYLYGSSFIRESARIAQQQRLNEYIAQVSKEITRSAIELSVNETSGSAATGSNVQQEQQLIDQLRKQRATGRIVLEFKPESASVDSIPAIPLENGDVFRIPPRPLTVSVLGSVYGQNIFLYNPDRKLVDYVDLAGKPNRIADSKHAFIIRADGSVYSRALAQGTFSNRFDSAKIYPGDAIVIPEKPIKPSGLRMILDYSQIFSSLGLTAAAISALK